MEKRIDLEKRGKDPKMVSTESVVIASFASVNFDLLAISE